MDDGTQQKTGGTMHGSKNQRTMASFEAMKQAAAKLAEALPDLFDGDAHAYLTSIYTDPARPIQLRIDAAGKAIAYEKPRLKAVAVSEEIKVDPISKLLSEIDETSRVCRASEDSHILKVSANN